eukprot:s3460_g1.t1
MSCGLQSLTLEKKINQNLDTLSFDQHSQNLAFVSNSTFLPDKRPIGCVIVPPVTMAIIFIPHGEEDLTPAVVAMGQVLPVGSIPRAVQPTADFFDGYTKQELVNLFTAMEITGLNIKTRTTKKEMIEYLVANWDDCVLAYSRSYFGIESDDETDADAGDVQDAQGSNDHDASDVPASDEGSADFDDSFLDFIPDVLCEEETGTGLEEDKHKVVLKTKCNSHKISLYFRPSQTVKSLADELSWLTDLDGAYTLVGQNTGQAWTLEQTISSLEVDDFTAYIQLKLKGGGGKRTSGGKPKADRESKEKEVAERAMTALLRIQASSPPDFLQRIVANIVAVREQLKTNPDILMDGLKTLNVEDVKKLQSGLSASHSYLRVSAVAKALYPTEHIQLEEIGKLSEYVLEAMKGIVELCILKHYSDDDGSIRWQRMSSDLIEIASQTGGYNSGAMPTGAGSAPSHGLGA